MRLWGNSHESGRQALSTHPPRQRQHVQRARLRCGGMRFWGLTSTRHSNRQMRSAAAPQAFGHTILLLSSILLPPHRHTHAPLPLSYLTHYRECYLLLASPHTPPCTHAAAACAPVRFAQGARAAHCLREAPAPSLFAQGAPAAHCARLARRGLAAPHQLQHCCVPAHAQTQDSRGLLTRTAMPRPAAAAAAAAQRHHQHMPVAFAPAAPWPPQLAPASVHRSTLRCRIPCSARRWHGPR